jgi:hypothetical protein
MRLGITMYIAGICAICYVCMYVCVLHGVTPVFYPSLGSGSALP